MKIADCRDKKQFMELFKEYEQIRARWVRDTPLSEQSLEELAIKFLNGKNVALENQGFCIFSKDAHCIGHIDQLYVRPLSRIRGIGKGLVSEAERELKQRGCSTVRLVNSLYNKSANDFYRSSGYTLSGESKDYYHFEKKI